MYLRTYIRMEEAPTHVRTYKLFVVYHIPCTIYLYIRTQQKFVVNGEAVQNDNLLRGACSCCSGL